MADNTKRTVAEKIAAAKRKHKAYMKEKALKNGAKETKTLESNNVINEQHENILNQAETRQVEQVEVVDQNQLNVTENRGSSENMENIYEADLPLPQYPMDNNYQTSSLPDPLAFFDNFNYVGATFQNLAQPLTSLFNNSNKNESNEVNETPNQILVDNSVEHVMNQSKDHSVQGDNAMTHQFFSYEQFKSNALKNPANESKELVEPSNLKENNFDQNQIFDEFSNVISPTANSQISLSSFHNSETFLTPTTTVSSSMPEILLNNFDSAPRIDIHENSPFMSEVEPDILGNNEYENTNPKFTSGISDKVDNESFSVSQSMQNLSTELKEYVEKEQELLNQQNIPSDEESGKRNQELFLLLEQKNAKCVELGQKLYESEIKYTKLAADYRNLEMAKEKLENEIKSIYDLGSPNNINKLRDDLQCHLQTIGMLVAEKTELTTLLQETQSALRNESSQCIDLQNEIKELKIYYSKMENELELLRSEKMQTDTSQREQAGILEKLSKELNEKRCQCEGHTLDLLESKEKLKGVTELNENLQKHIQELTSQLSMANIKIQQLTLQDPSQIESQLQKLIEEKASYEKQILTLNEALKTISKEREESSLQYQQYAEQLNYQISNLVQSLEQQQRENEQLKIQEENRIKHIGDLEKQLQNVQNDNTSFNLQRNNSFLKKELESTAELAQSLQNEKEELSTTLTKSLMEKEMLEKELESCKLSISLLESTVEQLRGSQPDNAVLLATMESDKVAASRAMAQNNELKKQMEGMQEVMVKVNNDNVQLTETVSMERKTNKELFDKLQRTEISFQTLADAIEIKDKELVHLRDQLEKMSRQIVQQEQLSDRLRHYEAQNNSSPSLQAELQEARQMIAHLTNELNIVKRNQFNKTNQMAQTIPIDQVNQINQTAQIDQMDQTNQTSKIDQTNRINQTKKIDQTDQNIQTHGSSNQPDQTLSSDSVEELRTQLNNLQIKNEELESMLQKLHASERAKVDTNGNETLDKETAMMHLEKKFLRTMEEIARLTEEKQRLEHLVLQLQGETETIGEYVTLYQQQRSILKQRALEKDQQLQQLTNDRETIKANLDRLNNLVKKLIVRKGAIPKELLDQHEHFTKDREDLCSEHQKIHQEINKLTSNGLNNAEVSDNANTEIAEEIISLLSEIKSSNLVQPNEEGLHHCPWCSGKLITV